MERLIDLKFYGAVEIAEIRSAQERRRIAAQVVQHDLTLMSWLSILQMESALSICSPDENVRVRAMEELLPHVAQAAECGVHSIGVISGRDVAPLLRPQAMQSLARSLRELADEAERHGIERLEIETMDREVHKRQLLGPTEESLRFLQALRREIPSLSLVYDTAHIALLEEDPIESLELAAGMVGHLHLSNCVADPDHPLYGDHHLPIGDPGFLDESFIGRLLTRALELGTLGANAPVVSIEVGAKGGEEAWDLEKSSRLALQRALSSLG
jgi:sugar phosphate isomerase/epimerase